MNKAEVIALLQEMTKDCLQKYDKETDECTKSAYFGYSRGLEKLLLPKSSNLSINALKASKEHEKSKTSAFQGTASILLVNLNY